MSTAVLAWVIAWGVVGAAFYTAGTIGLLRMPDLRCRLHALAKADTLGLGCVALAVAPLAQTFAGGIKSVLVWVFALIAAATAARALATPSAEHPPDPRTRHGRDSPDSPDSPDEAPSSPSGERGFST